MTSLPSNDLLRIVQTPAHLQTTATAPAYARTSAEAWKGTAMLAQLDRALETGRERTIRTAHDDLITYLRGRGPAPDWTLYPRARAFFVVEQEWKEKRF